ncbi:sugar transferase [Marisediminicola sp. LYQ85]|uniref:sugar transferase n=1 Tax=Marisediminicola sp. LYQ85 TaxID=3391062 RepID=UPI0039833FF5
MSTDRAGDTTTTPAPATAPRRDWREIYARRLIVTDFLVLAWVTFGVQIAWLGFDTRDVAFRGDADELALNYTGLSVILIVLWMLLLGLTGTRSHRVIGSGPDEYKLIATATFRLFGLVAIVAYLFRIDVARGYILIAFPAGVLVLMLSRWIWRQWLNVERLNTRFVSRVLLVGSEVTATHLARELARNPEAGYAVVGACLPTGAMGGTLPGTTVPVCGNMGAVLPAMEATGADTVAVTSAEELTPRGIRELSWSLEAGRYHLIVAPSLTDIGGPRIHTRPVAGLPLIHVETPKYSGLKHLSKRLLDLVGAVLILVAASPIFLVVAVLVRVNDPGPVLYRQERVGLNGKHFDMLKFRSMRVNADSELQSLLESQGTSGRPLFKVDNDPRVTRVGAFLRKYSLDELPQLLNVIRGDMSLVGPRPQRDGEVELYDSAARRRLLLKPGMSGLWQVSGRSALSWEDSIRLDLYYVENWSIAGDLIILWRTFRAVIAPGKEAI